MQTFIDRFLRNPITFEVTSVFIYALYCVIFAVGAIPSLYLIYLGLQFLDDSYLMIFLFTVICFVAVYVFFIFSSIVVGFVERLITIGFKPGAYPVGSPVFFRWLIYAGLHLWLVNLVFPFIRGNNWIKVYLRIAGAKVGRAVFFNTKDIYDPYLLEIGNEVMIGGDAYINCHLFENGHLNLGKVVIEDNATVGGKAYLTPGTRIGKNSAVGIYTYLRRNTEISDGVALISPPGMTTRQVVKLMRSDDKRGIER